MPLPIEPTVVAERGDFDINPRAKKQGESQAMIQREFDACESNPPKEVAAAINFNAVTVDIEGVMSEHAQAPEIVDCRAVRSTVTNQSTPLGTAQPMITVSLSSDKNPKVELLHLTARAVASSVVAQPISISVVAEEKFGVTNDNIWVNISPGVDAAGKIPDRWR